MPGIDQNVAANLPRRTGVTLREWVMLLALNGPDGSREEQIAWLRENYGLGSVQARVIVNHFGSGSERLPALADRIVSEAQSFGVDVRVEARSTDVPLIRHSAFAVMRRASDSVVDLSLALPGTKQTPRLMPIRKGKASRMTHHVQIAKNEDIDSEVLDWLRKAYELDA